MTKSKKSLLAFAILILVLVGVVIVGGPRWVTCRVISPKMMILVNAGRSERVFLLEESLHRRIVSLYVPLSSNDARVKRLVVLRFQDFDAVWSGDDSVLAFESDGGYIFAYDFKSGQTIPTGKNYFGDRSDPINPDDSEEIEALVRQRGDAKYRIPCSMSRTFVPIGYSEWKKFKPAPEAGKDTPGAN